VEHAVRNHRLLTKVVFLKHFLFVDVFLGYQLLWFRELVILPPCVQNYTSTLNHEEKIGSHWLIVRLNYFVEQFECFWLHQGEDSSTVDSWHIFKHCAEQLSHFFYYFGVEFGAILNVFFMIQLQILEYSLQEVFSTILLHRPIILIDCQLKIFFFTL
jgi:hypothetical protein